YAEQRGQGDSGGEYMGFGLLERYDCYEWIKWIEENTSEELPIYLAGISMGATTVLMTSGFELPERIHGIVADCGFTSPHAIWKHVVQNNLKIPFGLYSTVAEELCRRKIQIGSKDYSCAEALENCKVPVLFIHGTDDHFVPVEMTYENYKACKGEKRLLIVPGADHGMSYLVDQKSYEDAMCEFFKDFD
ncbi:MAG: alpha/beta hydrolase, partial [Ruminococcaceae bacterium]|nr:alpha/beta hydrolase [Oscillospiraceae bacterium]